MCRQHVPRVLSQLPPDGVRHRTRQLFPLGPPKQACGLDCLAVQRRTGWGRYVTNRGCQEGVKGDLRVSRSQKSEGEVQEQRDCHSNAVLGPVGWAGVRLRPVWD